MLSIPPDAVVLMILLFVCAPAYWYTQMRTGYWSTRYFEQVTALIGIGVVSLYLALRLLTTQPILAGLMFCAGFLFSAGYHLILMAFKLTTESDARYRKIHKANRALVNYNVPHTRFEVVAEDGVRIRGLHLNHNPHKYEKAIIVCHGAGRSKNTMPIVQTSQILSVFYPVFTFDFRGHMESSGTFYADGDTEKDLRAVIDYVRGLGYKKVAVIGWSIGAWTALLSASLGRKIDAIIAGAPPPVDISTLSQVGLLRRYFWIGLFVRGGVSVIRNLRTKVGKHVLLITEFVQRMPEIPVLLVYNEYDYTSRVSASEFEALYQKLPSGREKFELPGKGHIFDWPNTYFLWNKMLEWLNARF